MAFRLLHPGDGNRRRTIHPGQPTAKMLDELPHAGPRPGKLRHGYVVLDVLGDPWGQSSRPATQIAAADARIERKLADPDSGLDADPPPDYFVEAAS